jgi:hypothetical protein
MLPIVGFELFYDDELIDINQVIEAINKVSKSTLTFDNLLSLEEKELIEIHPQPVMRYLDKALGIELSPIKISKREALKLLKIANGSQELKEIPKAAKAKLSFSEIEIPKTSRKGDVFNFAYECIKAYVNDKGQMPASAEALIEHCMKIGVDGYSAIKVIGKKERDRRITCLEIPKGITWVRFAEWITKFKEKQN